MCKLHKPVLFLLVLLFCIHYGNIAAQSITLYTFPPAHPYRWHHPNSLLISTIRNYYFSPKQKPVRIIGHMVIELKKDTSAILTALTADDMAVFKKSIISDKIGLAVLFKLVDGRLEETGEVQTELQYRTRQYRAAFISFKITDSTYHFLKLYLDSFKVKGYDKLYNGLNRPRAGEGGGCTAFGISFLELINALSPEYTDQWAVKVKVPEKLIGDSAAKKKISILRLFFSFNWARKNEPSRFLTLYEPYLIYRWINEVWDNEQKKPNGKYQLKKAGRAKGLELDCRACMPSVPMFIK